MTNIQKSYFLYILECSDATLYTGITTDIEKRIRAHNGQIVGGAKYTKSRRPVELKYFESLESFKVAAKRERQVKKLSRIQKLNLIYPFNKITTKHRLN